MLHLKDEGDGDTRVDDRVAAVVVVDAAADPKLLLFELNRCFVAKPLTRLHH